MNCGLRIEDKVAVGPPSLRLPSGTGAGRLYKQTQFSSAGQAGGAVAEVDRAKQSQSREARPGSGGRLCETKPIGRAERAKQNQSFNCGFRRTCGLSPWLRAGCLYKQTNFEGLPCDIASMPRFAKQSQFHRVWLGEAGDMCETKPNLGELGHVGRGGHHVWGGFAKGERAKQTQFAGVEKNRWGKPHPTRGCNCAKQTQFRHREKKRQVLCRK